MCLFITIYIFLDAYNVHKPSNKHFAPVKNYLLNKKMHINIE